MTSPSTTPGVVRLEPDAALAPDPDQPGALVSVQYVGDDARLVAGTWAADAGLAEFDAYPVDEICLVLQGSITVETGSAGLQTFLPGDAFAIRRGTPLTWSQTDDTRKVYVVLNSD
jgi:uncharacterized cupin superfamily protein